jgi:hypothetical protein
VLLTFAPPWRENYGEINKAKGAPPLADFFLG